jgi:inosine-uridine nucleoside N-ribohydrolase
MRTFREYVMASTIRIHHSPKQTGQWWPMAVALLAPMVVSACDVGQVPDSGECVLASPLTCSRLTDVQKDQRRHVIFDTDAQFRGDPTTARLREQGAVGDQYALIYLLQRSDLLQLLGVTTANANGGAIDDQVSEVQRIASLCGEPGLPVKRGAVGTYAELQGQLALASFDGQEAVDFIIAAAHVSSPTDRLVILLGAKATNVALALTRDPSIAANIAVYWTATDEPGAAEETNILPAYRPGGSGMYNIQKDPEAANYLLAAPIELHLMQLWDVRTTPATQPRYATGVSGLGIKQAADLHCTGPRVAPVAFPDGSEYRTAGSFAGAIYGTFAGNGWRAIDEAGVAVLLAHPELAKSRSVPSPSYDPTTQKMVYPTTGTHQVYIYDAIQGTAIGANFLDTVREPFVSCEWAE